MGDLILPSPVAQMRYRWRQLLITITMEKKISEWLEEQGYPLEMRVARIFSQHGFHVIHSPYFVDTDTDTYRETDLIAVIEKNYGNFTFRTTFVIECKNNLKYPWVGFGSKETRLSKKAFLVQRCSNVQGNRFLEVLFESKFNFDNSILFKVPDIPIYNMAQAFGSNSDAPYSAMSSVSKATLAQIKKAYHYMYICEIAMPLIVLGGKFFISYLNENSESELKDCPSSTIIWRNPLVGMPHTIINICTFNNLLELVKKIKSEIEEIQSATKFYLENTPYSS